MSDYFRHILQGTLVFIAALGLGLVTAWTIIKLQKDDTPVGPLEHVVPARR